MDDPEYMCYVSNLHPDVTSDILEELFTQAGPLSKVIWKDDSSFRYALICFEDKESVMFAVEIFDEIELFGKPISVKPKNNTEQFKVYEEWKKTLSQNQKQPAAKRARMERSYEGAALNEFDSRRQPYRAPQATNPNNMKANHGRQNPNYNNYSAPSYIGGNYSYGGNPGRQNYAQNIGMRENNNRNGRNAQNGSKWNRPNMFNKQNDTPKGRRHFYE